MKVRINVERLTNTPRYCPTCDPRVERVIATSDPSASCMACGNSLCVVTPWSGRLAMGDHYRGSIERYSNPVALTTGKPTLFFPTFL